LLYDLSGSYRLRIRVLRWPGVLLALATFLDFLCDRELSSQTIVKVRFELEHIDHALDFAIDLCRRDTGSCWLQFCATGVQQRTSF